MFTSEWLFAPALIVLMGLRRKDMLSFQQLNYQGAKCPLYSNNG